MLGSTLYQLFNNLKIITTALIFRMIIKKPLKLIQWGCLLLLAHVFIRSKCIYVVAR